MHGSASETGEIVAGVAGACVVVALAAVVVPSARWAVGVVVAAVVFVEVMRARQPAGVAIAPALAPEPTGPWNASPATTAPADAATVPVPADTAAAADIPTVPAPDPPPEPVDLWAYLEHRGDPWAEVQCPSCGSADLIPTDVCRTCGAVIDPAGADTEDVFIDPRSVRSTHPA